MNEQSSLAAGLLSLRGAVHLAKVLGDVTASAESSMGKGGMLTTRVTPTQLGTLEKQKSSGAGACIHSLFIQSVLDWQA